jgi:hypothetical protein
MKLRIILATTIVLAFGLSAGLWCHHKVTRSPEYSLKRLADAIEQHDVLTFQELVDVDAVVGRFIDVAMAGAAGDTADGGFFDNLAQGIVDMMKPRLVEAAKSGIMEFVEKGAPESSGTGADDEAPLNMLKNTSMLDKDAFKGISAVTREGKTALVNLDFANARIDSTVTVQLRMRDLKTHWQVSEIANAKELLTELPAAEDRRLAVFNRPIVEKLKQTLVVGAFRKTAKDVDSFWSGEVDLRASIRNASTTPVSGFRLALKVTNAAGLVLADLPISESVALAPGQEFAWLWHQDLGLFSSEYKLLALTTADELRYEATFEEISMANGTTVKVFVSLDEALATRGRKQ